MQQAMKPFHPQVTYPGRRAGGIPRHKIEQCADSPADIYSIVQDIDEVLEAMAVEQRAENELGGSRMVLLVVLRDRDAGR
jgi:hypothetical protein